MNTEIMTDEPLPEKGERLQKLLAGKGLGSRRTVESWISSGRVAVNGVTAKLGDRAATGDRVTVDGKPVKLQSADSSVRQVIALNKPEGVVCSRKDEKQRPTVYDRLPRPASGRWIAVGRLDINTSGLLLLTNDGELANRLMHPSWQIEREYAVRVMGDVTQQKIDNLFNGVELEDGVARFTDIVDSGGSGINRWFHVCLAEGRNREVRRMWESQELTVSRLKRVRFGSVIIPDHLRTGQSKLLEGSVVDELAALVGMPACRNAVTTGHKRRQSSTPEKHRKRSEQTGRRGRRK